jgi:hypothetical protein
VKQRRNIRVVKNDRKSGGSGRRGRVSNISPYVEERMWCVLRRGSGYKDYYVSSGSREQIVLAEGRYLGAGQEGSIGNTSHLHYGSTRFESLPAHHPDKYQDTLLK